jgi:hypothetical protein
MLIIVACSIIYTQQLKIFMMKNYEYLIPFIPFIPLYYEIIQN